MNPGPYGLGEPLPELICKLYAAVSRIRGSSCTTRRASSTHAAGKDMQHAREHVEAMLGLEVWASSLYQAVLAPAHDGHDRRQHG